MAFLSIMGKTIPKIYFFTFIFSWTMLIGCATQHTTATKNYPLNIPTSQQKTMEFSDKQYCIYDSKGKKTPLEQILYQIGLVQVVFLGEMHNDPVAHALQHMILHKTTDRYWNNSNSSKRRQIVLSLEMFERDVQMVLDEYLLDIIDEHHFLSCVRPWKNYYEDYHPLIHYAKKNNLKVLASNAPRRYVHRVAQLGEKSLEDLSTFAKTWIAPLPIKPPSEKMKRNFYDLQKKGQMMLSAHKDMSSTSYLIDAQNLWDATMAYSISEVLSNTPKVLVLHLNGFFHTLSGTGIPEHLTHYRPNVKIMVINIVQNDSFPGFNPQLMGCGDFVIITDPNIRR